MNDDGKINMRQSPLCEVREKKSEEEVENRKKTRRNKTREFEATLFYTNERRYV